jgi:hypothetical protein
MGWFDDERGFVWWGCLGGSMRVCLGACVVLPCLNPAMIPASPHQTPPLPPPHPPTCNCHPPQAMGFDLKAWMAKPGKRFIYNEFALGGGISECGDTPAKTRAEAGRFPWLGGTSTFTQAINPWCAISLVISSHL